MDGLTKRIIILVAVLTLCHICIAMYKGKKEPVKQSPTWEQLHPPVQHFFDMDQRKVPC